MTQTSDCPKCKGSMDAGYLMDKGHANARMVAEWVEGVPEKSFWTGLKTGDRMVIKVTSYRCGRCGYLESYAADAPAS